MNYANLVKFQTKIAVQYRYDRAVLSDKGFFSNRSRRSASLSTSFTLVTGIQ
jgi:hypothetical protein